MQKQHNVVVAQPNNAQGDEIDRGKGSVPRPTVSFCHGNRVVGGGVVPDLRFMSEETQNRFTAIVLGGSLRARAWHGEFLRTKSTSLEPRRFTVISRIGRGQKKIRSKAQRAVITP